jgi:hypothetical protein
MEERPAPSPAKLLNQFNDWVAETEMPGRTMAYLKTGFLHEVLAEQGTDVSAAMIESWTGWEKGDTRPEIVLGDLQELGLVSLLTELSV